MPKAREMALQALAIDGGLAEAHTSLAIVLAQYDYDYRAAEREHLRAIALNPRGVGDLYWYGHMLRSVSRFDEALTIFERARQIDPLSPEIHRGIAHVHFAARRMDQAIEQSLKLLDLDPNYAGAYWVLARAYEAKGMYDAAVSALLKMWALDGGFEDHRVQNLQDAYAAEGWVGFWHAYRQIVSRIQPRPAFQYAEILVRLGKKDEALRLLEQAYDERSGYLHQLTTNPIWDSLRSEDGFKDVIRRASLRGDDVVAEASSRRLIAR